MAKQQPTDKLDPLSQFLSWVTLRAALRPGPTLGVAFLITCAAIALAATRLEFRTSRLDLLSASASYNQRWLAYLDKFGKQDDAVVIVSHSDPAQVTQALIALGQRLESDDQLQGVMYRRSLGNVADKALSLMPPAELERLHQLLSGCLQTLGYASNSGSASAATSLSSVTTESNSALSGLHPIQQSLAGALTQAQLGLDQLKQSVPREGELLLEDEGRLGLCLLRVPHMDDEPAVATAQLKSISDHIDALRTAHPEVTFGLTGMPVLEWDESRSSQNDMQKATLLSLVGVAVIFVFGFGSWRMPCAAVLCLAIGLIWTVGLATLLVGHLNLFSVAFGAIIAGLGIDYAIHLLSRLHTQDDEGQNAERLANNFIRPQLSADELPAAMARAVAHCGKGIFTGAVTTAAAFGVAVLTPFRGMTELGVICAAGTLACMVVTIWILPALLSLQARLLPTRLPSTPININRNDARPYVGSWLAVMHHHFMRLLNWSNTSNLRWRVPVLLSTLCITTMSGMQIGRIKYDHNLLNLQAANAPSVQAEHELTSRSRHSAWFAVSVARSATAAHALRQRLEQLPSVARVEEIGSLMASSQQARSAELTAACRAQASQLIEKLTAIAAQQMATDQPSASSLQVVLPASFTATAALDPQVTSQLQLLAQTIADMSSPGSLAVADFPDAMRSRMISQDGSDFLVRIYGKHDLWQRENLGEFVKELESVDPRVTGHPVQTWYASAELENSYYQAGIYALIAVIGLLMIDLGSLRLVALALVPVSISAVQLCGWLIALKIPFNAANMIVLPLIIGIGIDDGLHIMHDFASRGSRRFCLSGSTTLAVLLTSLTTMVGFGSMAIADHRGLYSLGIVLLTGVGLCLWHSWFTLPALLSFLGPQNVEESQTVPIETEALALPAVEPAPLLMRDVPVVLSLPDYPELRS